jgi:hypothetical protein
MRLSQCSLQRYGHSSPIAAVAAQMLDLLYRYLSKINVGRTRSTNPDNPTVYFANGVTSFHPNKRHERIHFPHCNSEEPRCNRQMLCFPHAKSSSIRPTGKPRPMCTTVGNHMTSGPKVGLRLDCAHGKRQCESGITVSVERNCDRHFIRNDLLHITWVCTSVAFHIFGYTGLGKHFFATHHTTDN